MNSQTRIRGKGAKPAMVHTNVRLPEYVVDYFKNNYTNYTAEIRSQTNLQFVGCPRPRLVRGFLCLYKVQTVGYSS
jgi:hypothetical protein